MRIKTGTDEGNSGAIIRWGCHLDNGIWLSWKRWHSRNMLTQFRIRRGYVALSLLTVQWGNA